MPTTQATADTAGRTVDEQFLDLLCNDPGLLAAEFDAIIAAQWPDPPMSPPHREAAGRRSEHRRPRGRRSSAEAHPKQKEPLGVDVRCTQRSPPHLATSYRHGKVGDRHT